MSGLGALRRIAPALAIGVALPAHAADVLIPEATPRSLDDFSVAYIVYDMVLNAAREAAIDLEDAEQIRRWAGATADGCWDNESCPANLWENTPARLVVVMSVGQTDGELDVSVRLHGADDDAPFKVLRDTLGPGEEQAFAAEVARSIRYALPLLPERAAQEPEDPPPPLDLPRDPEPRDPEPRDPEPRRRVSAIDDEEEQRSMGVPDGAFARYRESGMRRDEWVAAERVRSGRAFFELAAGWGRGDVDRGYGVRLQLAEDGDGYVNSGASTWEGDGQGEGLAGWVAVGYAPTWFLDTSMAVGVQYGRKHLDIGWECAEAGCDPASWENVYDPVFAAQLVVEPRARVYPLATGMVKPYLLAAFTVRVHDGFDVPDPDIAYPGTSGGSSFGPTVGLGVMIDPVPPLSFYLEAPATFLLSASEEVSQNTDIGLVPGQLESKGWVLRVVGGVSVRM